MKSTQVFLLAILLTFPLASLSLRSGSSKWVADKLPTVSMLMFFHGPQADHSPTGDERANEGGHSHGGQHGNTIVLILLMFCLTVIAMFLLIERQSTLPQNGWLVPAAMYFLAALIGILIISAMRTCNPIMGDHPPTGDERPDDFMGMNTHHPFHMAVAMIATLVCVIEGYFLCRKTYSVNTHLLVSFIAALVVGFLLIVLLAA